ncbi:S1C family serine protease [Noviherbaspirillum aerium]|uniref:S1C family serine protease n=1 Tax=Noviherbaspirillum aerium TaxID=2588497 RepID=UPI00124E9468|nr:trypsin-like peptidase domain-containing protein [Noviherbaspirillum aerium]
MKKQSLYSKSVRPRRGDKSADDKAHPQEQFQHRPSQTTQASSAQAPPAASIDPAPAAPASPVAAVKPRRFNRSRAFAVRHEKLLLVLSSVLLSLLLAFTYLGTLPKERKLTQKDIDAAVLHTLENKTLPSAEVKAFERIRPSVVRVTQVGDDKSPSKGKTLGVGTGVVVVDKGVILTNLHVVAGAEKLQIDFADGTRSDAVIIGQQPENDLAVLQASKVPDDLIPATLRSTKGLAIGEKVMAVGFPFNIGPSASSGIISGLKRNYQAEDEKRVLANLIQFDAAANPGNSGGPLITMSGEVVGIVTAILSPNPQGSFIGIGFAVPIETAAAAAGEAPF